MRQDLGDIPAFARAVNRNPENPQIDAYLESLDLTQEEREEVKATFAELLSAVTRPGDSPVPRIVKDAPEPAGSAN